MKKIVFFIIAMLIAQCASNFVLAQGEWKWAHYWSGNGGDYNNIFNKIYNTAFDDNGNIYVYGTMGGNAVFDGITLSFSNNSDVITTAEHTVLLAKFDTLGNMLWYKIVKCSNREGGVSRAHWMEVKDDKVYILGNMNLDYVDYYATVNNVWLYYFDTLITGPQVHEIPVEQRRPPYKTGRYTYFATFDLDGNLLDNHFMTTYSRETYLSGDRRVAPLCELQNTPMHVDNSGNTYIYTFLEYKGSEENPFTLIVDGDTNKSYDIYLPGTWQEDSRVPSLHNMLICKFSPTGELVFAKRMIDHTEGIVPSWEYLRDSINPSYLAYPTGLSFDDEDNMYVSGQLIVAMHDYDDGGQLHQYPAHIYWDSSHYATIHDMSGAARLNFVIKYDTNGNVQWCNQIYTQGNSSFPDFSIVQLFGISYYNHFLYLSGRGTYRLGGYAGIFFDEAHSQQLFGPQNIETNIGFFARYDAVSGEYINYGVVPIIEGNSSATPGTGLSVINNRVFSLSTYKQYSFDPAIIQWTVDGSFINHIPFACAELEPGAVNINQNGEIIVDMVAYSSVIFSENIQADCNVPYLSKSVFALYHNPEFATPFVGDDTTNITSYYDKRENDIYLYPNPTSGQTSICGYMYDYKSLELYDLQGRKLADLVETWHPSAAQTMEPIPAFDLSPYPAGTYLVKINFNRGVSVVRKVVKK